MALNVVPQNWRDEILVLAKRACVFLKIKETTLGNKIVNDANFFPSIRLGRGCHIDQYNHVLTWFADNLPKETKRVKTPKINKS
jgi:hypothetical protein